MATFADFALLRAEPSYGGAEVLRARRVLSSGEGTPVHLALFGEARAKGARERSARIAAVAASAAQTAHDQVARILEVGSCEGSLYATAVAADGVDLGSILEMERGMHAVPDISLALSLALQLAQIAVDLHERGDVWAAEGGTGLSALFPAGLHLDALVLKRSGALTVRILAGAAADPAKPTAFRAPELRAHKGTVASDVFIVAQTLRALLTGDATATSAPRLQPAAAPLGPVLAAALNANPDERLGLFMLVERLGAELARIAGKTKATAVAASFLQREYKSLVPDEPADTPLGSVASGLRARLSSVRSTLQIAWPRLDAPPLDEDELGEDGLPTTVLRAHRKGDTSSAIGRVFDDLSETDPKTQPIPMMPRGVLDVAAASFDEHITEARERPQLERTSESDPPWISMSGDFALIEAASAPAADPADLESGPTIEMHSAPVDDDETDDSGRVLHERPRPQPPPSTRKSPIRRTPKKR